jgi:serine/threonine protein kinase
MKESEQRVRHQAEEIARQISRQIASDPARDPLQAAVQLCGTDQVLLMKVIGLLDERLVDTSQQEDLQVRDPFVNQKIGGFKIRWKLGTGGNGDVYLATRIKEPHQQVAIKFLRLRQGESDQFRRRFLRERQIIALLNYPYIVKLFDADRTKDGTPYFVMEYVQGSDLDKFSNTKRLTVLERIGLFLKVCDAIQYLHQHLIVHRDLKPANIMVDNDGNPRVLDFGIAKLLRPELMDGDLITITNQDPMTPQYASPEQWQGRLVTSSSDVYSLGVILFQILTGRHPMPWTDITPSEYRQRVCEGNRPKASRSVVQGHAALCREYDSAALEQRLVGDLDAILAKALHQDVIERYPTVEAFAEDIRRHLQFLPVRARGESATYRTKRFLRRNRAWTLSALGILLALSVGLGATLVQKKRAQASAVEARTARDIATSEQHKTQLELDRVKQLVQQRSRLQQNLQDDLNKKTLQERQFRVAVQKATEDLRTIIVEDERIRGKDRGEASGDDPSRYATRGRNYEILGRLLTLSSDKSAAHQAFENCVFNFTRAQRAGDHSDATIKATRSCQNNL